MTKAVRIIDEDEPGFDDPTPDGMVDVECQELVGERHRSYQLTVDMKLTGENHPAALLFDALSHLIQESFPDGVSLVGPLCSRTEPDTLCLIVTLSWFQDHPAYDLPDTQEVEEFLKHLFGEDVS